jgi:hypothetical protein
MVAIGSAWATTLTTVIASMVRVVSRGGVVSAGCLDDELANATRCTVQPRTAMTVENDRKGNGWRERMAVNEKNPWGEQREVLALLGATLRMVQMAERMLRACMTYALPKGGVTTADTLEEQTTEEAKKTLGYFLGQLRRRVDVEPGFDIELSDFLDLRNRLVHDLDSVEGIDFATLEGRVIADAFIRTTATKSVHIIKVFTGLLRSWAEQVGIQVEMPDKFGANVFDEIDTIYKPMVEELFSDSKARTSGNAPRSEASGVYR